MTDQPPAGLWEVILLRRSRVLAALKDAFIRHSIDNRGPLTSAHRAAEVAQRVFELATDFLSGRAGEARVTETTGQFAAQGMAIVSGIALIQALGEAVWPELRDNPALQQDAGRELAYFQLSFMGSLASAREAVRQRSWENSQAALQQALHEQLERQRELFTELRRSEEKYRTILENIEEGYYETDLSGNFTFVNDSVCNILARPKSEILNTGYRQWIDPDSVDRVSISFEMAHEATNPAKVVECKLQARSDGAQFVELSTLLLRNRAGEPVGFRGTIRDITKRKQSEQLLIERIALERSNRELEQFAYVASHDLQEPLNKIHLFGDRLQATSGAKLDEAGYYYLERMQNAAVRMQSLIDNLLTLSRVTTRGQPFTPVNLAMVAQEVVSDLEARLAQSGGQIEIGELPVVDADPVQMHQLLQNLIGNGLKFHQPDARPFVRIYSRVSEPRCVDIVVEDNGIGFEEKHLERIFQPFQRLHAHSEYEGTGMGLAICQRIAERHGGQIAARSILGQGATFIVTLPVLQAEGSAG
ncbi:MAG: ATP-binding protein [Chloroflexi bacterium]|nr:ATP-binding protein [Chloroflexota bacterium]MCI0577167.1 ATP-binding protein [Chloroflexota bacterium]MCI0649906.1 ATP-binding protein [Chloroflexota bacterium]MCI0725676.1 ATP-binding protein [Chloroflexota bacterium]